MTNYTINPNRVHFIFYGIILKLIRKPARTAGLMTILGILLITGCSRDHSSHPWLDAVPQRAPAFLTPQPNTPLTTILQSSYAPLLEDISKSAFSLLNNVQKQASDPLYVKAVVLYPGSSNTLQPVWITKAPPSVIKTWKQQYSHRFQQNEYQFHGQTIQILHLDENKLFATYLDPWLIVSENSLGLEDAVRAYRGLDPSIQIEADSITGGRLVLNTPYIDEWIKQLAQVTYRPKIQNAFKGTGPAIMTIDSSGNNTRQPFRLSGRIPLDEEPTSLVSSLTTENAPIKLDRYISSNAASFVIFRRTPHTVPPNSAVSLTALDSLMINDLDIYRKVANTLGPEFALADYAESGFLSVGEELYIRHLSDPSGFRNLIGQLENKGMLRKEGGVYFGQSRIFTDLLGSELCPLSDFYLGFAGKSVILSKRKGLAESVEADRSRRRVIYYEPYYREMRKTFPEEVSGLAVVNSKPFAKYIQPFLAPDNNLNALTSRFDLMSMTFEHNDNQKDAQFSLATYNRQATREPYEERWIFPLSNVELTGPPVTADIGGSTHKEVIFATTGGKVYALATDGTVVMQASTGVDDPIGSPIVYDWYGNNQDVIMLAANNKVYAWNTEGNLLPKFPLQLDETISAPLQVADISRDGIPEAIVATTDRNLHVLDGRGNDISGWPRKTNAIIKQKPEFRSVDNQWSLWAFAGNGLHAWLSDGSRRPGYPVFINANFDGGPAFHKDHILGSAVDGHLYAIGKSPLFSDSLDVYSGHSFSEDLIKTQAVYVANSGLVGTPEVTGLDIQQDSLRLQDDVLMTISQNGSVFLMRDDGRLILTENMGQASNPDFNPMITPLRSSSHPNMVALAKYGRLYAWDLVDHSRTYSLPSAGMDDPIISDIDQDGRMELIGQTSEGLRCWVLNSMAGK